MRCGSIRRSIRKSNNGIAAGPMSKLKKLSKFLPILGIALFLWILKGLGREGMMNILSILKNANLPLFISAAAFGFFVMLIKAWKWQLIVHSVKLKFSLWESYIAWLIGFGASIVTPGRVGDFYRVVYVRRANNKASLGVCLSTVFFDRLIDIFIMVMFAGLGILYLIFNYQIPSAVKYLVFAGVLGGLLFVFLFRENVVSIFLRPMFNIFIPDRHKENVRKNFKVFFTLLRQMLSDRPRLAKILVVSIIGWMLSFVQTFVFAVCLGIDVSYPFIMAITPIINMVEIVPISFSGIGTRDAVLIYFFSLVSLSSSAAVSYSFMILSFSYLSAMIGLLLWWRYPMAAASSNKKGIIV